MQSLLESSVVMIDYPTQFRFLNRESMNKQLSFEQTARAEIVEERHKLAEAQSQLAELTEACQRVLECSISNLGSEHEFFTTRTCRFIPEELLRLRRLLKQYGSRD